jgi:xylulokinase
VGLQQHGSVYWSKEGERVLASLDAEKSLASQLQDAWAQPNAPIWQDSSTRPECDELEKLVGGAQALADLTGSRAYERFTASQIMKVYSLVCLLPSESVLM